MERWLCEGGGLKVRERVRGVREKDRQIPHGFVICTYNMEIERGVIVEEARHHQEWRVGKDTGESGVGRM